MPWRPPRAPGAAGSTPPRVEPALRCTRCLVSIRSIGEATAAAAVACVRWDVGAGPAGCSSRHGSTCTSPRIYCSASSRASWPSSPRRHPVRTLHPTRAEHQVPYWAIRTPPTCFRGSAELLGPQPRRGPTDCDQQPSPHKPRGARSDHHSGARWGCHSQGLPHLGGSGEHSGQLDRLRAGQIGGSAEYPVVQELYPVPDPTDDQGASLTTGLDRHGGEDVRTVLLTVTHRTRRRCPPPRAFSTCAAASTNDITYPITCTTLVTQQRWLLPGRKRPLGVHPIWTWPMPNRFRRLSSSQT